MINGFVKSPSAALPCILCRCGVLRSTPHSTGFARLASGAFYFAIPNLTFFDSIMIDDLVKSPKAPFPVIPANPGSCPGQTPESSYFKELVNLWTPVFTCLPGTGRPE